jgi:CDP-glycerol glycerophosphotransferase
MKKIIKKILRRFGALISFFFPINKNKILISSYYGRGYGDNLKYIIKELLSRNIKGLKLVWVIKDKEESKSLPNGIATCFIGSIKFYYHMATSKIWLDNCRKSFYYKKKKQFYIQTWHGFALKKIEKDAEHNLSPVYVKSAKKDSTAIDVIVSCSAFMNKIYRNSFWYDGDIVNFGAPRNDIIVSQDMEIIKKVKSYFSIEENTGIILYAPTFRKEQSLSAYSLDYKKLMSSCNVKFGKKYVVLVRLHPNITDLAKNIEYNEEIKNATSYPDMQELLVATDLLISDYSSLMFDYALSYKPVFMFATDIDSYKNDRNFYFNLMDLPFAVSINNEELERNIMSFDAEEYRCGLKAFFNSVGMICDGQASNKVVDMIISVLKKD